MKDNRDYYWEDRSGRKNMDPGIALGFGAIVCAIFFASLAVLAIDLIAELRGAPIVSIETVKDR